MNIVGMMAVRNEDWVLALTARAALMWCDQLVILDHASTDATADIIDYLGYEYGERLTRIWIPETSWDEMEHRQLMLVVARRMGGTHMAIIDADEILTGNLLSAPYCHAEQFPREMLSSLEDDMLVQPPLYNLRNGIGRYHSNGIWGNRIVTLVFQDSPSLHYGGDKFHAREPQGRIMARFEPIPQGEGGVMHLWGASERRLIAKHALYKVTERLRWPAKPIHEIETLYNMAIKGRPQRLDTPSTWEYTAVPDSWWEPYSHLMPYLDIEREPWQEQEVRRLVQQHGCETFAGLDLFGVA